MATYDELLSILGGQEDNGALENKVRVACTKKAQLLMDADGKSTAASADEVNWAIACFRDPAGKAAEIFPYVVMANSGLAVGAITGATDTAIQTNVDAAVDELIAQSIT